MNPPYFHLFFLKLNEHFQCWNHFLRYGKFSSVITLRIAPPPTHLTYSLFSSWNWIRYIWNFQNYPPYLFLILSFFSPFLCDFSFLCVCYTFGKLLSWILQLFKCLSSAIYSIFSKYLLSIKYVLGTILGMGIQQWANKVMAFKSLISVDGSRKTNKYTSSSRKCYEGKWWRERMMRSETEKMVKEVLLVEVTSEKITKSSYNSVQLSSKRISQDRRASANP